MGLTHPDKTDVFLARHDRIIARRAARGLGPNAAAEQCKQRYAVQTDADFYAFCAHAAAGKPIVDLSPGYCQLPPAGFARLKACFPTARIVLLLRNPADWAWSYRHLLTRPRAAHDAIDFANNYSDKRIPDPDQPFTPLRHIYDAARSAVPASDILCLFTEDLFDANRQQTALGRLSNFVGVAPYPSVGFSFDKSRGSYDAAPNDFRAKATVQAKNDIAWACGMMGRLPANWEYDCAQYLSD